MIVTCDYGAPTKISEVIFKKFGEFSAYKRHYAKKFRLEYLCKDEWTTEGEFETGIDWDSKDLERAYHIKLPQPIFASQVRIVIEKSMFNSSWFVGRVGFVAHRSWIKNAIDDCLSFKRADQIDSRPVKEVYEQDFNSNIGLLKAELKFCPPDSQFVKQVAKYWPDLFKMLTDYAEEDLNQWFS